MRRLRPRRLRRGLTVVLVLAIAVVSALGLTAANVVPQTHAADVSQSIALPDVVPSACAGLQLTNIVSGQGNVDGTNQNDLVLGGPGVDTLQGKAGDDCLVGGDGDDQLRGGPGTDVCIGEGGTDTFDAGCETQIP